MVARFVNSAKKIDLKEDPKAHFRDPRGLYSYDQPSPYLYVWSRLLQCLISVAATKMLTDKWHTECFGIYKSEGGCNLPGVNALVLSREGCYFDYGGNSEKNKKQEERCAQLISEIVINWNPDDPIKSMFSSAADFIGVPKEELENAVENVYESANPFGGDAISRFFDHNPFGKFPTDRDYLRYCLVHIQGETNESVDQQFADEDLGSELLEKLQESARKVATEPYSMVPMCCSPKRNEDGLKFWINGGKITSGWYNHKEIENIIADPMKFMKEE